MGAIDRMRLDGKLAVVTGASKNIGLEITRAFAEAGATVLMNARDASLLGRRAEEIRASTAARIETVVADVSRREGVDAIVGAAHAIAPKVDVLVNNAYTAGPAGLDALEHDEPEWDACIRANLLGPYQLCQGLVPAMRSGGGGSVINVLSGSGFQPGGASLTYSATKAALWMLTRQLSWELAPSVRVNALVPGLISSETGGPDLDDPLLVAPVLPTIPMGRAGHPSEVAPAALYLASDAATYTTGTVLFVNGGRAW